MDVRYPNLERKIRESGKSKKEIIKEIGIPVSTFYDKLAGKTEISIGLAKKIRQAIGTEEPLEELFGEEQTGEE